MDQWEKIMDFLSKNMIRLDNALKEYIEEFRRNTISVLENTYIVTPDGKKHPLPRKQ